MLILALAFIPVVIGYTGQEGKGLAIILAVFVGIPLVGVLFSFVGTMLPATVDGTNASFKASWRRAKGNFWYTFLRMAAGPFLLTIVILAAAVGVGMLGVPPGIFNSAGGLDPVGVLVMIPFNLANLFVTAIAATVLCKTYLRAEQATTAPDK